MTIYAHVPVEQLQAYVRDVLGGCPYPENHQISFEYKKKDGEIVTLYRPLPDVSASNRYCSVMFPLNTTPEQCFLEEVVGP